MSIPLNSIDCPCLTNDCLKILIEDYSIYTTNDFVLWLIKSLDKTKKLSSKTIQCIKSCIIAHTANIQYRQISNRNYYKLNYLLFDNEYILKTNYHIIFIYEYFNQNQWNKFFNILLIRLFNENELIKINYINTNISLFDLNYFYYYYCCLNEKLILKRNNLFEEKFFFNQCFNLEIFENQLNFIENNNNLFHILIIDDFFSLIKPYLNLDRRIKNKILQLTYRLNYLAQKQSILIINGIILNTNKQLNNIQENFLIIDDIRFDSFHADQYILFQSKTTIENDINIINLNKKIQNKHSIISKFDLDDWININNGELNIS
ncbi:unnamed protein product [Rotaria sp. Silwood1]|nr:unnamed protein product [Rotaria sp. Silwood1]CAF1418644.1 unnamed protein product [Rotaria sp. Silwood1]CAF3609639.1 unnamed protein product [Rotaria sp. Silwood1]